MRSNYLISREFVSWIICLPVIVTTTGTHVGIVPPIVYYHDSNTPTLNRQGPQEVHDIRSIEQSRLGDPPQPSLSTDRSKEKTMYFIGLFLTLGSSPLFMEGIVH